MKTFKTMLKTELKLSLRGMDMVIFAICVQMCIRDRQWPHRRPRPDYPPADSFEDGFRRGVPGSGSEATNRRLSLIHISSFPAVGIRACFH